VLTRASELVEILDRLVQSDGIRDFLEMERGLDLQGDGEEKTCAAEAAEGRLEEVMVLCRGASDYPPVRQE
jgi:hypothetical protein